MVNSIHYNGYNRCYNKIIFLWLYMKTEKKTIIVIAEDLIAVSCNKPERKITKEVVGQFEDYDLSAEIITDIIKSAFKELKKLSDLKCIT